MPIPLRMSAFSNFMDWAWICLLKQLRPCDPQGAPLRQRNRKIRNSILQYYKNHPSSDATVNECLQYLRRRTDAVYFPAPFRDKYRFRDVPLDFDADGTPFSLLPDGNRLYFLPDAQPDRVRMAINNLRIEQDEASPHRYLTDEFTIVEDDILADVGCAEGILSLQYAEKAKHIYLFETEEVWIKVLEKTFAPWRDKVTIVKRFVSDQDKGDNIRLDTFFRQEGVRPTFVKLDVEGGELAALRGMEGLFVQHYPIKIAACCYHYQGEYDDLKAFASQHDFRHETSTGWMLFGLYDEPQPPFFRHGLLRMWANER